MSMSVRQRIMTFMFVMRLITIHDWRIEMTRLDNVCTFVTSEIQRRVKTKIVMCDGLSVIKIQVIFKNDTEPYNFYCTIEKMSSDDPDSLVKEFMELIKNEWLRRLYNGTE